MSEPKNWIWHQKYWSWEENIRHGSMQNFGNPESKNKIFQGREKLKRDGFQSNLHAPEPIGFKQQ
jgi:hypothetical protein